MAQLANGSLKCCVCSKSVYEVEKVLAMDKTWHKNCFQCGINSIKNDGCGKTISTSNYLGHDGIPYCNSCYTRQFSSADQKASSTITTKSISIVPKKAFVPINEARKCCACEQLVYKFDEHQALDLIWHKNCFRCGGIGSKSTCRKLLSTTKFHKHDNHPYCTSCSQNLFRTNLNCAYDGLREPVVLKEDWEVKELDPWGEPVVEKEEFWVDKTQRLEKDRREEAAPIKVEGGSIHDRAKELFKDKNVVKVERKL